MPDDDAWRAGAAYLYTLFLDGRGEAWECLRRNSAYRAACRSGEPGSAADWGLAAFEDPDLDARVAQPIWIDAAPALMLVPTRSAQPPFDLWDLPAPRRIVHDGKQLRVVAGRYADVQISLAPTLRAGRGYAYQLPAERRAARRRGIDQLTALDRGLLEPDRAAKRDALVRMRTFAALDGAAAGASHREIATALFGSRAVAKDWTDDGAMRAQVRHLLTRGRRLVAGGYRSLLDPGD